MELKQKPKLPFHVQGGKMSDPGFTNLHIFNNH